MSDERLHLTLAFLGHRPEGDAAAAGRVLEALPSQAVRMRIGPALLLPSRAPRVLTASMEDLGGLMALQTAVADGLAEAAIYVPEERPFRPHVTVARLARGARPPRGRQPAAGPEPVEFAGECVSLFSSQPGAEGSRYTPLTRVPLGG